MRFFILLLILLTTNVAHAIKYSAGLNSEWSLSLNSKLECKLSHEIPNYGIAEFSIKSGSEKEVSFFINQYRNSYSNGLLEIYSKAPNWKHGIASREIGDFKIYKNFSLSLTNHQSYLILNELEKGFIPTFLYKDLGKSIEVELMPVNFSNSFKHFNLCIFNLLDYSFQDIKNTTIHFEKNKNSLTRKAFKKLEKIIIFLNEYKDIKSITLNSYTDSYGGKEHNKKISQQRAEIIKDILIKNNIPENKIKINAYGEKKFISSNKNEKGREKNRRVIVNIEK